jgi:oligo-1,6-glucosidase/alpha-glucosidase
MPWNDERFAGFSTSEPWLPLNEDWQVRNVAAQERDANSMLTLYRRLLALRRQYSALSIGDLFIAPAVDGVLQYERHHGDQHLMIALNFGEQERQFRLPHTVTADVLLSTVERGDSGGALAPNEGVVLSLRER